ncbi:MAG TPA: hypothetical protein VFN94_08215 [Nitrospiria bacterium]|nr:hypothetical protein [Nitrospiria bacterium]
MPVRRHKFPVMLWSTGAWRSLFSVCLLIAYAVLVGDAIHCQYSSVDHDHHDVPKPQSAENTTHCLVANHGSAALPTIAPGSLPGLHSEQYRLGSVALPLLSSAFVVTASRAPPRL